MLFDVEGFFCPKKQDSAHDLKLFALASLTSSMLIYNTLATINSCGLSDLHFGSQLSREFIPESKNLSELSKYYPILVWTIRDHFLDLTVEKNGQTIAATSDEYMEDCLEQKNGQCSEIKENFKNRKCFAFPEPVAKKLMKKLDEIPAEELDQDFVQVANDLLVFIEKNGNTKNIIGQNGEVFTEAFKNFLNSIQEKHLNLESVYDNAETAINQKAFDKVYQSFKESLNSQVQNFPGELSSYYRGPFNIWESTSNCLLVSSQTC